MAFLVLQVVAASFAIACVGTSVIGLLLGSWYVERFVGDIGSKWLLVLTIICVFTSCMLNIYDKISRYFFLFLVLLSCGVWSILLTTNLYQNDPKVRDVRLADFGFSLWINIGASGFYFYAFFIYLIAICRTC